MPVHPSVQVCTHIKVTGVRCGSPALRGEQFCYFHQRMIRGVQIPTNSRLLPVALLENEEAIQSSIMEVINALARNTIDFRRADLILKALHIAVKNSRRVRFDCPSTMVREVPNYPIPPKPVRPEAERVVTAAAIETAEATIAALDFAEAALPPHTDVAPDPTQRKPPQKAPESPAESQNERKNAQAAGRK